MVGSYCVRVVFSVCLVCVYAVLTHIHMCIHRLYGLYSVREVSRSVSSVYVSLCSWCWFVEWFS